MLQTQTVEAGTLDLIKTLLKDAELSAFNLVGGTALSLQIGHRKSIDIDLFTNRDFDAKHLATHLSQHYPVEEINQFKNGILCFIGNVKVDLIAHQYPIIHPITTKDGIRMLSLSDIAAMKLNAILNNGSRLKDFIDIFFLLERMPLEKMTDCFVQKYPDVNVQMAHAALLYHQDINKQEKIEFLNLTISLHQMEYRLQKAVQNPLSVFKPELTKSLLVKKRQNKYRRGPRL